MFLACYYFATYSFERECINKTIRTKYMYLLLFSRTLTKLFKMYQYFDHQLKNDKFTAYK